MNVVKTNQKEPASPTVTQGRASGDEIIDLRFLFQAIWRGKWVVLIFICIGAYNGYGTLRSFNPSYVASMIVSPYVEGGGQSINGALSQLAQSAGFSASGSQATATPFDRLKLTTGSISFATNLNDKHDLLKKIFGGSWDEQTQTWTRPSGRRFELIQRVRQSLNLGTWREPDLETLASYLGGSISITNTHNGLFKKVSVTHPKPEFALWLLKLIYFEADESVRQTDRNEAETRKSYLNDRLAKARLVDTRNVLLNLLENVERRSMLLEGTLPYAAKVVEKAYVSTKPTTAKITADLIIPVAGYGLAGAMLILIVAVFRRETR